jgi:hypothetical protein
LFDRERQGLAGGINPQFGELQVGGVAAVLFTHEKYAAD